MLERTCQARLDQGVLDYVEMGEGRPVVFVHGLLVNADLWRDVLPLVAGAGYRCLAPDWPLGSHRRPMAPGADLSPPGLARLIADFLAELDLRDVLLVANDTGGALTQILMAEHPDRIAGVVLTPSDAFERFFPPMFAPLPPLARVPGAMWLTAAALRSRFVRGLPFGYGWIAKRPIPGAAIHSYVDPVWRDRGVRADLGRFLRGVHRRHTLAAARKLADFRRPVLLAWAAEDRLFPMSLAHRLAEVLPDARIAEIPDSHTFVPEDQPAALGELIVGFAREKVFGLAH
ncbi:alpha/beta fold hydrolase [Actinokineospora iranica]|uniref:Pimeloyl-ACP methyl ester carboxylesterase n=1 Tax=Actinokineospora iranica TaxID=1271860 RepID=A0A1G6U3R1_9PSEU|nr:alpha/beta hydrolase [Actinokineospora iranica]SDD35921.1 Pimeloyl-ACP methyl ester carboxylesterase [Actinokineospora iranica]